MRYLVIDIGGTFTKYALMDEEADILYKDKRPTAKDSQEHFVEMLVHIYEEIGEPVGGIAISSAGVIEPEGGIMHNAGTILCVRELPIARTLQERCGVPVTVENDGKAAALAELWKGSLKDCQNAMVMICGTAVGGALICNRQLIRGSHRMAGEFSYLLTDAYDTGDSAKTFAGSCGVPALLRLAEERKGMKQGSLDGERVFALAKAGDGEMLGCIQAYARRLAVQILNVHFVFDPERIAIGGGISRQPLLLRYIREALKELTKVYPHEVPLPEVVSCAFYNDANLIGALYGHLKRGKEEA